MKPSAHLPTIMTIAPGSCPTAMETQNTSTDFEARGLSAFAAQSLVAANDAAIMRARLEALVRPVTFAQSRRVA